MGSVLLFFVCVFLFLIFLGVLGFSAYHSTHQCLSLPALLILQDEGLRFRTRALFYNRWGAVIKLIRLLEKGLLWLVLPLLNLQILLVFPRHNSPFCRV